MLRVFDFMFSQFFYPKFNIMMTIGINYLLGRSSFKKNESIEFVQRLQTQSNLFGIYFCSKEITVCRRSQAIDPNFRREEAINKTI
jgi:hypothetical protein